VTTAFGQFGIPATCNSGGAGKCGRNLGFIKGANNRVIADKDEPGRKHVAQVAQSLIGKVKSLKVIECRGSRKTYQIGIHRRPMSHIQKIK